MTARCLRDKVPKGDFIIRAGVLDRLVENKLYYKFVEYGERVKEQRMVDKEREKSSGISKNLQDVSNLMEDEGRDDEGERLEEINDREAFYEEQMNKPLFDTRANPN